MAYPPDPIGKDGPFDGAVLLGQPEEPKIEDLTFVDLAGLAFTKASQFAQASGQGAAGREFNLAKTHLEEAVMRFNRGAALVAGVFAVADIEAEHGLVISEKQEGGE